MRTAIRPQDSAEKWEIRFTEAEGGSYFRTERASHPYTPRREADIPAGAKDALHEVCGIHDLGQVFIIPWAVRSTGQLAQKVISPNSVLALGDRAVGLWTEKPLPGVKITIPLEKVAAIEDVTILLYGRLSFVPFGDRLTIRYNTVARQEMEPALLALRSRLAGVALPLPDAEQDQEEPPFKWKVLLERPLVRLSEQSPVIYSFAFVRGKSRDEIQRRQLIALNPFELVYLSDPMESTERYGVDSFVIPRSRITEAQVRDNGLEVCSNGARIPISMAPALREAAMKWLGRKPGIPSPRPLTGNDGAS
jgi:hypothetical protein